MKERVNHITSFQVHSDDVRMVFGHLARGHHPRNIVIQSVGEAMMEKRLKAWKAYTKAQEEYPEFKQGLDRYLVAQQHDQGKCGSGNWDEELDQVSEEEVSREANVIKQVNGIQYRNAVRDNMCKANARGPLNRGHTGFQPVLNATKPAVSASSNNNNSNIATIPTLVARQGKKGVDREGNPIIRGRYYKPAWENISHFRG